MNLKNVTTTGPIAAPPVDYSNASTKAGSNPEGISFTVDESKSNADGQANMKEAVMEAGQKGLGITLGVSNSTGPISHDLTQARSTGRLSNAMSSFATNFDPKKNDIANISLIKNVIALRSEREKEAIEKMGGKDLIFQAKEVASLTTKIINDDFSKDGGFEDVGRSLYYHKGVNITAIDSIKIDMSNRALGRWNEKGIFGFIGRIMNRLIDSSFEAKQLHDQGKLNKLALELALNQITARAETELKEASGKPSDDKETVNRNYNIVINDRSILEKIGLDRAYGFDRARVGVEGAGAFEPDETKRSAQTHFDRIFLFASNSSHEAKIAESYCKVLDLLVKFKYHQDDPTIKSEMEAALDELTRMFPAKEKLPPVGKGNPRAGLRGRGNGGGGYDGGFSFADLFAG